MSDEPKYVMGVDEYGYDGHVQCICVIRRVDKHFEYVQQFKDKKEFNKELKRVATYYGIPEDHILREPNR